MIKSSLLSHIVINLQVLQENKKELQNYTSSSTSAVFNYCCDSNQHDSRNINMDRMLKQTFLIMGLFVGTIVTLSL
jgi:hypothetical protein